MSFGELGRTGGVVSGGGPRNSFNGSGAPRGRGPGDVTQTTNTISEYLRQYQHNLALLERLADALDAQPRASDELLRQVATQQDVVEELARALRRCFAEMLAQIDALSRSEQGRPRAALTKLRKDFERVATNVSRVVETIKASRRAALSSKGRLQNSGDSKSRGAERATPQPHRVGRAQFGHSDAPGDLDVMIGDERVQLQVAMQEEAINDAILREREEEIREINQNVHKVNEIFRDLATLVEKQQGEVDQIGELVEKSHVHAEKGLEQVQKAAKLQPSCSLQ